ncbi:MAG: hypothetical protein R2712_01915 [Vicinamibacterales bacterium]
MVDEIVGEAIRATGWSIETWFAILYVVTVLALAGALWALGQRAYRTPLAVWTLLAAETLRHRITRANSALEATSTRACWCSRSACGRSPSTLRGRPWMARRRRCFRGTTSMAAFFLVFLVPALGSRSPDAAGDRVGCLCRRRSRRLLLLAGPLRTAVAPMDRRRTLLASRTTCFP